MTLLQVDIAKLQTRLAHNSKLTKTPWLRQIQTAVFLFIVQFPVEDHTKKRLYQRLGEGILITTSMTMLSLTLSTPGPTPTANSQHQQQHGHEHKIKV